MKKVTIFCCTLLVAAALQAQIIHVPGDYPTIQLGINAATPGDTVLVAEGTYYEQINFLGKKPLMVTSQFLMDGDTSHIGNTIIDGSQITDSDSGSIVNIISGEDTTSILCGFTIQNGNKGTLTYGLGILVRAGGSVFINRSGAKIIHNHITENHLIDNTLPGNPQGVVGAGIYNGPWIQEDHWLVLDHNVIDHNSVYSNSLQAAGGGVSLCFSSIITNNVISDNISTGGSGASSIGAGIVCGTNLLFNFLFTAIVKNNVISNNQVISTTSWAHSSGVFFQNYKSVISENNVENNLVNSSTGGISGMLILNPREGTIVSGNTFNANTTTGFGGGLEIEANYTYPNQDTVTVVVENNYFTDNEASNGGGFYTYDNPVILQNNVFRGNHASSRGGGMYLWNYSKSVPHLAVLINNSFSGNKSDMQGAAITSRISKPVIFNSIFWKDSTNTTNGTEIYLSGQDTVEIAYSDIDLDLIYGDVRDGGGNINQDPMFVNLETLLTDHNSPCVDAGTSGYTCNDGLTFDAPDYDILGNPRPQGEGYDMGAYDMDYWPVGIRGITNYGLRITNDPNPFIESMTFSYTLKESSQVIIQIFNSFGQMVAEPLNTTQSKGEHQVQWNAGNLLAGIYYYRIQAGSQVGSGKMVKS